MSESTYGGSAHGRHPYGGFSTELESRLLDATSSSASNATGQLHATSNITATANIVSDVRSNLSVSNAILLDGQIQTASSAVAAIQVAYSFTGTTTSAASAIADFAGRKALIGSAGNILQSDGVVGLLFTLDSSIAVAISAAAVLGSFNAFESEISITVQTELLTLGSKETGLIVTQAPSQVTLSGGKLPVVITKTVEAGPDTETVTETIETVNLNGVLVSSKKLSGTQTYVEPLFR